MQISEAALYVILTLNQVQGQDGTEQVTLMCINVFGRRARACPDPELASGSRGGEGHKPAGKYACFIAWAACAWAGVCQPGLAARLLALTVAPGPGESEGLRP